ncbi:MAG: prepilin peptidase dependent protein type pilus assembly protein PilA [Parcubacteria group bacterium]|nr:prepilin peptidase dependent protein type pilus assembly protein PilA [Parcubacteria group bacterium]
MISQKGFTLIELLVVIAIIGILSSIVLSSLNTARTKGTDAAVKSNLDQARTQAELFYSTNGDSYNNGTNDVCAVGALALRDAWIPQEAGKLLAFVGLPPGTVKGINSFVLAAAQSAGLATVSLNAAGGPGVALCNSSATAWAAEVPLKTAGAGFFCVDNTGIASTSPTTKISTAADRSCL